MPSDVDILEIQKLFDAIPESDTGNKPVRDGIVNAEEYAKAHLKVLWVLKEANDEKNQGGWDFKNFLSNGKFKGYSKWKSTYSLLLRVMYGVSHGFSEWSTLPNVDEIDSKIFESMAYINLKKIPGGSQANPVKIAQAYQQSKELILKQIESFKPDVVIFCGMTMHLLSADLGIDKNSIDKSCKYAHCVKVKSTIYINTYHPAQRRIKHRVHYEAIIEACKKGLRLS